MTYRDLRGLCVTYRDGHRLFRDGYGMAGLARWWAGVPVCRAGWVISPGGKPTISLGFLKISWLRNRSGMGAGVPERVVWAEVGVWAVTGIGRAGAGLGRP